MKRYTERGFAIYEELEDRAGIKARVQESSLATEECVWLFVGDAGLHLNYEQATKLVSGLNEWRADVRRRSITWPVPGADRVVFGSVNPQRVHVLTNRNTISCGTRLTHPVVINSTAAENWQEALRLPVCPRCERNFRHGANSESPLAT